LNEEDYSKAIDEVLGQEMINTRHIAEQRFSMDRFISDYQTIARELTSS
jgi:hypothetical protein